MRLLFLLPAGALLLGGCLPGAGPAIDIAEHDLPPIMVGAPPALNIDAVSVEAASWLSDTGINYRLNYAEASRRRAYGHSRWAAPPAELVERVLMRHLIESQPGRHGGCRINITLTEFAQEFASPTHSDFVVEARVFLLPARGERVLARRIFVQRSAAPSADAAGGIDAARASLQALAVSMLHHWLADLRAERPYLAEACRSNGSAR